MGIGAPSSHAAVGLWRRSKMGLPASAPRVNSMVASAVPDEVSPSKTKEAVTLDVAIGTAWSPSTTARAVREIEVHCRLLSRWRRELTRTTSATSAGVGGPDAPFPGIQGEGGFLRCEEALVHAVCRRDRRGSATNWGLTWQSRKGEKSKHCRRTLPGDRAGVLPVPARGFRVVEQAAAASARESRAPRGPEMEECDERQARSTTSRRGPPARTLRLDEPLFERLPIRDSPATGDRAVEGGGAGARGARPPRGIAESASS